MLPAEAQRLLEDIFAKSGGETKKKMVQEDPDACLVSLLTTIVEDLPKGWKTLGPTVDRATYDERVTKAKGRLNQVAVK